MTVTLFSAWNATRSRTGAPGCFAVRAGFGNIIKNAAESIESAGEAAGKQGEITVRTTAPALIEIVDNGPGISKETEAKLFSPFFSTNRTGRELAWCLSGKF